MYPTKNPASLVTSRRFVLHTGTSMGFCQLSFAWARLF